MIMNSIFSGSIYNLSGKSGWRLLRDNSLLLLHNSPLALSNVTVSETNKLEPSIVAVRHHGTESEECSGYHCIAWNCRYPYCCDEIQQCPCGTENQFNENPWNTEEAFDDVKHIEQEQCTGEPEASHRDKVEERWAWKAGIARKDYAEKAEQVERLEIELQRKTQMFLCGWVEWMERENAWVFFLSNLSESIQIHVTYNANTLYDAGYGLEIWWIIAYREIDIRLGLGHWTGGCCCLHDYIFLLGGFSVWV